MMKASLRFKPTQKKTPRSWPAQRPLLEEQKLYLDPDLTLNQIARRLILPIKGVSSAVNRTTGENVSRYINARRMDVA